MNRILNTTKTTIYGVLAFLAIASGEVKFLFDADPLTNPNWTLLVSALLVLFGFKAAKDASSKETIKK